MGTNSENGIRIFSITIRIYSNIRFGRSCLCRFGRLFLCRGTGHVRIMVHHTINLRCKKFGLGVSKSYLQIAPSCDTLFLDHLEPQEEDPAFANLNIRNVCVTRETSCQHESITSIVKKESSSNRTIFGGA